MCALYIARAISCFNKHVLFVALIVFDFSSFEGLKANSYSYIYFEGEAISYIYIYIYIYNYKYIYIHILSSYYYGVLKL